MRVQWVLALVLPAAVGCATANSSNVGGAAAGGGGTGTGGSPDTTSSSGGSSTTATPGSGGTGGTGTGGTGMGGTGGGGAEPTRIGVFRPADATWTLDDGNGIFDGCGIDTCLPGFGGDGDIPVAGDWGGTGASAIGVFRPSDTSWTLDNGNGAFDGCGVDPCFYFGGPGYNNHCQ